MAGLAAGQFPEWLLEELLLLINTQAALGEFMIGIWGMQRLRSQAAGLFLVLSTAVCLLLTEPSPSSGSTSAASAPVPSGSRAEVYSLLAPGGEFWALLRMFLGQQSPCLLANACVTEGLGHAGRVGARPSGCPYLIPHLSGGLTSLLSFCPPPPSRLHSAFLFWTSAPD